MKLRSQGKIERNPVENDETFTVTVDDVIVGTLTRQTRQTFTGRGNLVRDNAWTWVTAAGTRGPGTTPKRGWALDALLAAHGREVTS